MWGLGTQYDFFFRDMIRNHGRERKKSLEEELKKLESQTNAEVFFFAEGGGDSMEGELIPFSGKTKSYWKKKTSVG